MTHPQDATTVKFTSYYYQINF